MIISTIPVFFDRQLSQHSSKVTTEKIIELDEEPISVPAHRTRKFTRNAPETLVKTSDYSSEESLDRLKGHGKEIFQVNIVFTIVLLDNVMYLQICRVIMYSIHGRFEK